MALVGEALLSGSIKLLCDKIASGQFMDFFRARRLNHSLMDKLKVTLMTLHAVLDDAEEKQIVNDAVAMWLDELKDAVFDAQDLVDEMDTEALRRKVKDQTKQTQVCNFLSTSLSPFNYKGMNGRIKDLFQRLEHLAEQRNRLGLREGVGRKVSQRTPTTSVVEEGFCPYGRDADKEKLKTLLLPSDNESSSNFSVVPIVGMGGVGKTTLAQLLYNDEQVKEHFDIHAWVCVSEQYDALRVIKTLSEQITEKSCDISDMNSLEIRLREQVRREQVRDISDMNSLEIRLREQVRGKTFLFVLDDLWNESYDEWDRLRTLFTYGAKGSKVIVTTRSRHVASTVYNTIPTHDLEKLSDDDCWLLLTKHAFRNEKSSAHPDLEEVGKKIARKCNGLPLASKTLGSLLGCNLDYKEWNHILDSNLWDLPHANSVLPSLRLSYHYLPSYLKRCFAYCSIFPKGYELEKENVILLWVAEGLIPQSEREKAMEEVGERYFDELLSRSLFQKPRLDQPSFTMHDLINDLAMFVSREFCFRLDQKHSHEVPKRVRHFSYMRGNIDTSSKFQPLGGVKCLHTFFPVSLTPYDNTRDDELYVSNKVLDDLLPTQKCLRAFSLSRYKNINHLPNSIGNHIHLRYIDLSYTTIKMLPDTMCSLYNLQTLLLLGCSSLVKLPANMKKLIHLRHLDIRGTDINEMPVHMGRLKSLRTLTAFVLGKSTGSNIGELRELSHLRGKISILNLQNVVGAIDALLKDKKDLNEVELAWGYEVSNDFVKKKHVLERLQPPVNLVKLTIKWYGGTSFPNWVGDSSFSNLQVMRLSGCSDCSSLPPVGRLPALKELYVGGMTSITSVGVEFYGGNQPFQSLEKLEFVYMPKWEEWLPSPSGGESPDFPRLKELILDQCPKLRGNLPTHLPSLGNLGVYRSNVLHWSMETLPSLQKLDIDIVGGKEWLPQMVRNSNCLQSMTLSFCSSLLSLPTNGLPTTLTSLRISYCKKLEFLCEMMAKLTSLQSLRLSNSCDSLRSFPLGIFPKLSCLEICSCRNLKSLSVEGGADENLSRLNSLRIETCPNLVAFPDGGLPTPNLTSFYVSGCKSLKLLPDHMHTLTALQELWISNLPNVVSFAQGGLPPNLQSLSISDCNRLRPSVEWGLQGLVCLRQFRVSRESKDLLETLLNEQLLPATLHTLQISSVWNLKSLDGKGLEHLTSLQQLQIEWCGSLKFLPKEGFPASLSYLNIRRCPSLKKRYLKKRYENVARIPCVKIDGEVNIL
nr:putative disease resistance RPP13-like protein 1 [Malus domestica]XP_028955147.1 putative disease resistance RPP13-like protein 1 [Malus domestica]